MKGTVITMSLNSSEITFKKINKNVAQHVLMLQLDQSRQFSAHLSLNLGYTEEETLAKSVPHK